MPVPYKMRMELIFSCKSCIKTLKDHSEIVSSCLNEEDVRSLTVNICRDAETAPSVFKNFVWPETALLRHLALMNREGN